MCGACPILCQHTHALFSFLCEGQSWSSREEEMGRGRVPPALRPGTRRPLGPQDPLHVSPGLVDGFSRRGDSGQGLPARTGCIFPGSIPILTRLPPGQGGWGLGVGVSGQALNLNGAGGWGDKGEAPWGGVGCTQQDHSPISWGRTGVRADGDSAPNSDSNTIFPPLSLLRP